MRQVVELLRLRSEGRSVRQVARSLGLARSTVADYFSRATAAGLSWPLPSEGDEAKVPRALAWKSRHVTALPRTQSYRLVILARSRAAPSPPTAHVDKA